MEYALGGAQPLPGQLPHGIHSASRLGSGLVLDSLLLDQTLKYIYDGLECKQDVKFVA